jgi:hypothetical protein
MEDPNKGLSFSSKWEGKLQDSLHFKQVNLKMTQFNIGCDINKWHTFFPAATTKRHSKMLQTNQTSLLFLKAIAPQK